MNWKAMADKAKQTSQRGGSKAAKEDAEGLRKRPGQGSFTDKAKDAAADSRAGRAPP